MSSLLSFPYSALLMRIFFACVKAGGCLRHLCPYSLPAVHLQYARPPICPRHPGEPDKLSDGKFIRRRACLPALMGVSPLRGSRRAVFRRKYHYPLPQVMAAAGCSPGICSRFEPLPVNSCRHKKKHCSIRPIMANLSKALWENQESECA